MDTSNRHSTLYRDGPYSDFRSVERSGGSLPVDMILAHQKPHSFVDPATEELVLALTLGGNTPARWKVGSAWRETPLRRRGAIGISPIGEPVEFDVAAPHSILVVAISPIWIAHLTERLGSDCIDLLSKGCYQYWYDASCERTIVALWEAIAIQDTATNLLVDGLVQALIGRIIRLLDTSVFPKEISEKGEVSLTRLQAYVRTYACRRILVDDMARLFELDRYTFARLLKQQTGLSPYQYVQQTRIDMAKALLIEGNSSLSTIAFDLGFADHSHFSRVFKKVADCSPKEYKMAK